MKGKKQKWRKGLSSEDEAFDWGGHSGGLLEL